MRIAPAAGLVVRDPFTKRPLPIEGREVAETSYWLRRLADGDVIRLPDLANKSDSVIPVESDLSDFQELS